MNVLEHEIEDLIFESIRNGNKEQLLKRGLYCLDKYNSFAKQVNLGVYGILDMVGFKYYHKTHDENHKKLKVGVFELKKGVVNSDTLFQAIRYCKAIKRYIDKTSDCLNTEFNIYLIGTSVCLKSDFCYTPDIIENVHIFTTQIDLVDGVRFQRRDGYYNTGDKDFEPKEDIFNLVTSTIKLEINNQVNRPIVEDDLPF